MTGRRGMHPARGSPSRTCRAPWRQPVERAHRTSAGRSRERCRQPAALRLSWLGPAPVYRAIGAPAPRGWGSMGAGRRSGPPLSGSITDGRMAPPVNVGHAHKRREKAGVHEAERNARRSPAVRLLDRRGRSKTRVGLRLIRSRRPLALAPPRGPGALRSDGSDAQHRQDVAVSPPQAPSPPKRIAGTLRARPGRHPGLHRVHRPWPRAGRPAATGSGAATR